MLILTNLEIIPLAGRLFIPLLCHGAILFPLPALFTLLPILKAIATQVLAFLGLNGQANRVNLETLKHLLPWDDHHTRRTTARACLKRVVVFGKIRQPIIISIQTLRDRLAINSKDTIRF